MVVRKREEGAGKGDIPSKKPLWTSSRDQDPNGRNTMYLEYTSWWCPKAIVWTLSVHTVKNRIEADAKRPHMSTFLFLFIKASHPALYTFLVVN
jgi:hypothetical protein